MQPLLHMAHIMFHAKIWQKSPMTILMIKSTDNTKSMCYLAAAPELFARKDRDLVKEFSQAGYGHVTDKSR